MSTPHSETGQSTAATSTWERLRARVRQSRWMGRTHGLLIANLIAQMAIIVTGGAVRLTASGLGCSQWPACQPGRFTPQFHEATAAHEYIEFGNRTLTFVLVVLAVAVALVTGVRDDRSPAYRFLGLTPLIGVFAQAIIGGVVVLLELNPAWVALHYLVSAGLVWVSTLLLYRSGEGDGAPSPTADRRVTLITWALGTLLVPILLLGAIVTGSGPHGGDDEVAYRFSFDPVFITRFHAGCVWVFLALLVALIYFTRRSRATDETRRAALVLVVVTVTQGLIGYVQYFTSLPAFLVGMHMAGSALLTAATTWLVLTTRTRSEVAGDAVAGTESGTVAQGSR